MRILKELEADFVEVRILKELVVLGMRNGRDARLVPEWESTADWQAKFTIHGSTQ